MITIKTTLILVLGNLLIFNIYEKRYHADILKIILKELHNIDVKYLIMCQFIYFLLVAFFLYFSLAVCISVPLGLEGDLAEVFNSGLFSLIVIAITGYLITLFYKLLNKIVKAVFNRRIFIKLNSNERIYAIFVGCICFLFLGFSPRFDYETKIQLRTYGLTSLTIILGRFLWIDKDDDGLTIIMFIKSMTYLPCITCIIYFNLIYTCFIGSNYYKYHKTEVLYGVLISALTLFFTVCVRGRRTYGIYLYNDIMSNISEDEFEDKDLMEELDLNKYHPLKLYFIIIKYILNY